MTQYSLLSQVLRAAVVVVFALLSASLASAGDCNDSQLPQFKGEFRVKDAIYYLHPGDEFTLTFNIFSNRDIQGFKFLFDFNEEKVEFLDAKQLYQRPDGAPFEVQSFEANTDNKVPNRENPPNESLEEGYLKGELYFSSTEDTFNIPASQETPVFEFRFRVRPGTLTRFVEMSFQDLYTPEHVTYYNTITACSGEFEGLGFPYIGVNVAQEGVCLPGSALDVTFSLEDAFSTPGSQVTVPFSIQATKRVDGFGFSVDFDEEVLQATKVEMAYQRADGQPWGFQRFSINNSNNVPGSTELDEGFLAGIVVFSFDTSAYAIPAHQKTRMCNFCFTVNPATQALSTELRFLDGAKSHNDASICRESIDPPTARSFVFVNGVIGIIDEITIFIRGDSNGDERVDISDAVATLAYLFLSGERPACFDAADANDDGKIDVSDPVATLNYLFLGSGTIPPPNGTPGEDPTPDSLRCIGISG